VFAERERPPGYGYSVCSKLILQGEKVLTQCVGRKWVLRGRTKRANHLRGSQKIGVGTWKMGGDLGKRKGISKELSTNNGEGRGYGSVEMRPLFSKIDRNQGTKGTTKLHVWWEGGAGRVFVGRVIERGERKKRKEPNFHNGQN